MTIYTYGRDGRRIDDITIRGPHALARVINPALITRIVRAWTGHNYRRRVYAFTLSDGRIVQAVCH